MEPLTDALGTHGEAPAAQAPARPRRGLLFWLVAGALAALIALLLVAVLRPAQNNPLTSPNRPAQDFTMSLYNGGTLRLSALRGKTVVLNFWWSNCAPCVQEAALLQRQWLAWKNKDVVFVGIDELDDPHSAAPRQFLRTYHITYPNGWDPGDVSIQYGTTGQPETFVISPRGVIRSHYVLPFTDDRTLSNLIREARA